MADENTNVTKVKMLVVSGKTEDSQFFDYRPSFYAPIVRVEWDLDTMEATIAADAANYLIEHGYAVRLTPEPEPAPIVTEVEPLVVETDQQPSSAPSADATASVVPTEATPAPPPSPEPSQAPPAAATSSSSSGGKKQKKEKSK